MTPTRENGVPGAMGMQGGVERSETRYVGLVGLAPLDSTLRKSPIVKIPEQPQPRDSLLGPPKKRSHPVGFPADGLTVPGKNEPKAEANPATRSLGIAHSPS